MPTPTEYTNAGIASAAIKLMAEHAGLEGCEDPGTGAYHMLRMLIDFADVHNLDLDTLLSEVRADIDL